MKSSIVKDNLEEEKKMENPNEIEEKKEKTKNKKDKKEKDEKFEKVEEKSKKVKKEIDKMAPKNNKKKWIIISIIAAIIIVIGLIVSTIFAFLNINNEKIINGISIQGVDVSGLNKEEASAKMETIYQEKKDQEITIQYQDYIATLNPTLLEVEYSIEEAVNEAYLIGRNNNIFVNNYQIVYSLFFKNNINVDMKLNEEVSKQTIEDIGANLPGIVIESSYSVEEDKLIITKGNEGIVINSEELLNKVKEKLNNIENKEETLEIPVINKKPEEINIEKIHEEICKEPQDAYFTKDPFAVYPEVDGVDFNLEEAKVILAEDKEEYIIPLKITKANVTIAEIGTEAFPNRLATFTTRFDESDKDRTTNLRLACQKINGKVVLAGDTFSYNKTLGARTVAAGYKNAKIYEAGEVVDGLGGGICQISSTLYNSVLMANLQIVERRNHQFVTSYVPAGRDATVVYGATDFKFKNTRKYPIRIVASAQNGIATVSIYGIKEENEYTFTFNTKTIASIPFTTRYVEDGTLSSGTEKVKQKGANGLKTETYMTKSLNGKVISTTLLSKDTYDAMTRIILKGTKGVTTTTVTPDNTNTKPKEPVVETIPSPETPSTETSSSSSTEQTNTNNE